MAQTKTIYHPRSAVDRRSPLDRRILDMGSEYTGYDRRKNTKDRRKSWEDRCDWKRISKWSSAPAFSDLP